MFKLRQTMRMVPDRLIAGILKRRRDTLPIICISACVATSAMCGFAVARVPAFRAQAQPNPYTTWTVTIVLAPRLMAGHPATLAVFGVDRKLAAGVTVTLGDGQTLTTDRTGRALFTVPVSGDYLLAKGAGASVAALIDPAVGASEPKQTTLPSIVSMREGFWICSGGLRGDADADSVRINNEPALVLAASPECLVALPSQKAAPGPAMISLESPGVQATATTTLVALDFDAPQPALIPEQKSRLDVRVRGSDRKIGVVVENETPGVLRFLRGDTQELFTSGGPQNGASLEVQAIRSGDYSFRAGLIPEADTAIAQRYLLAAVALAPKELQSGIQGFARRLARQPRDSQAVRAELGRILGRTIAGDFRTLLNAAFEAL
jgi:hypothetical protein